ncbi:3-hydroxyacyl-CoA dehydrogenase family protein [Caballeronia sp.]|uniref:3-hydroxyacyl-CoA dehydrogenase family protein n=1 Tax=Caballeronia sp. TaxID=1931223 RepID=UPI003C6EA970
MRRRLLNDARRTTRILVSMINEPSFVLAEGVASVEEINTGMKLGGIHPIGNAHARGPDRLDVCRVVNGGARQRISATRSNRRVVRSTLNRLAVSSAPAPIRRDTP